LAELVEGVRGHEIEAKEAYISETMERMLEMTGNPSQCAESAVLESILLSMMAKVVSIVVMEVCHIS